MSIGFELKIEQSQKLVMTPELQQAITLLQFSSIELNDFVQKELENNPVLEIKEGNDEEEQVQEHKGEKESTEKEENTPLDWNEYLNEEEDYYRERRVEYHKQQDAYQGSSEVFMSKDSSLWEDTLENHLLFQLHTLNFASKKQLIGEYIIGNLDSRGYLQGSASEHVQYLEIGSEEFEEVLTIIQGFEPPGVAARSLKECLLVQLYSKKNVPSFVKFVIEDYLEDIAEGRYKKVARALGITVKELQHGLDVIRNLNPKPGSAFKSGETTKYIYPDLIVKEVGDEYEVIVNDNTPSLFINPFYRRLLQKKEEEANEFLKKRFESALWLIKSIERRRITLYNVAKEITAFQTPFFKKGLQHLRPLTMKDIAEKIGVHESTVSRATTNKYMQTPRGLFPLKFFFSTAIEGVEGEMHSAESIRSQLKALVEEEDPTAPYSDQQLADFLKEKGINASRRTIAKYRKEIDIPSSYKRRRL